MQERLHDRCRRGGQFGFGQRAIHQSDPTVANALRNREGSVSHPQAWVAAVMQIMIGAAELPAATTAIMQAFLHHIATFLLNTSTV